MKNFFKEFKEFAMQGNVLDMAVGIIIGGAFTAIVTSLVNDILNPIIGLFTGNNLDELTAKFGQVTFKYGAFLSSVINFIIVALVIFIIVKSINKLSNLKKKTEIEKEAPPEPSEEVLLLREIRDSLKK